MEDSQEASPASDAPLPSLPVRPAPFRGQPAKHEEEEPRVEVSFVLEQNDLDAFERRMTSGKTRWPYVLVVIVGVFGLVINLWAHVRQNGFVFTGAEELRVLLTIGLPLLFAMLFYFGFSYLVRKENTKIAGLFEPRKMGLSPSYIHATDAHGEGKTRWQAVKSVDGTGSHIFIILSNNTGFVIPNRAFADDVSAKAFLDQATDFWKAGREGIT